MSGARFFMFLLLIPALVALGHDCYLFYVDPKDGASLDSLCSLGFIWTRYAPESFRTVRDMMEPADWNRIQFLLQQKAFFAGLAFAFSFYLLLGLLKILRLWPFRTGRSKDFSGNRRISALLNADPKKPRRREKF